MITSKEPAGLYIHIPFCLKKCDYCGFASFASIDEAVRMRYISCLIKEIKGYTGAAIDTVFIGGGTPSLMTPEQIKEIIDTVTETFTIPASKMEITIEANPKTLTLEKLVGYRQAGVNRLSIGCQSLSNEMLSSLGRVHTKEDFTDNYRIARQAGFDNINMDLMFNIPGQNLQLWIETLDEAIRLAPEHISFYSLELEEGTPFYQRYKNGDLDLATDNEMERMYKEAVSRLQHVGYHHYEISNCARMGYECKHNLKYWSFVEYYGVGLGAHSFTHEHGRKANPDDLDEYMEMIESGNSDGAWGCDKPATNREAMGEYVFTHLRKREGVNTDSFRRFFGIDFYQVFNDIISELRRYQILGYLIIDGPRIALTEDGISKSNQIMAEFV